MMKISGVSEQSPQISQAGMSQMTDAVSKNLQTQIMNAQRQLKDLSSNEEMSAEEKMEKRKEIQQQIADLNNQLRQHQIELRKGKQQSEDATSKDVPETKEEQKAQKSAGISDKSMRAMISADTAVDHAESQGNLRTAMAGRVGVLEAEIETDKSRGKGVEGKQEELADLEKRLSNITGSQMNHLTTASDELETAVKEELEEKKGKDGERDDNTAKRAENNNTSAFINDVKARQRVATDFSSMNIKI